MLTLISRIKNVYDKQIIYLRLGHL